jgi:hypothetical protein
VLEQLDDAGAATRSAAGFPAEQDDAAAPKTNDSVTPPLSAPSIGTG